MPNKKSILCNSNIVAAEKRLLSNNNSRLFLLVDKMYEEIMVHGVFTSYDLAHKYMVRFAINYCIDKYTDIDQDEAKSIPEYYDFVDKHIKNTYEILIINHIDEKKPVYQIIIDEHFVSGTPGQYLTNFYGEDDDYKEESMVKVDPSPPKLSRKKNDK